MSVEDMQFALVELKESRPGLRNYYFKMLRMVVHQIDGARKALNTLRSHGKKTGKLAYAKNAILSYTINLASRLKDMEIPTCSGFPRLDT